MPLEPGSRLGPFEVLSRLGAGGMGEVWRARDTRLQRDVAIKVLPEAFAQDTDRLLRFTREAHVLASLNHPNIAAIYSFEEIDGVRFLVLELVSGETLKQRIVRAPVSASEAIRFALQIADALEAAHAKGVLHRDLKPANVNVTPEGKVKLLDFGLAKAFALGAASPEISHSPTLAADPTHQGVVLGTASYMSPEQARGRALDARSDLWSFGCVLYEMLAGRKAFDGESVSDILVAILDREPDWAALPAATPAPLRDLMKRLLRKDPAGRPATIGDTRGFLEAAAGSRTTAIFPVSGRSASAARRGGGRALLVAGSILLVVGAALFWVAMRERAGSALPASKLLAILPATDLTGRPDGRQLCDGVSISLGVKLQGVPNLAIMPPSGPAMLKETDPAKWARDTGANLLVQPAVRQMGEERQLSFSLSLAGSPVQIAAGEVTGPSAEHFRLEEELARKLVAALRLQLSPGAATPQPASVPAGAPQTDYVVALGYLERYDDRASVDKAIALLSRIPGAEGSALVQAALGRAYLRAYALTKDAATAGLAQQATQRANALDPDLPEAQVTLGEILTATGRSGDAIAVLKKAVDRDPSSVTAILALASALQKSKDTAGAERTLLRLVELRPTSWSGFNRLGTLYFLSSRYEKAVETYRRAIALNPDVARMHFNLGAALLRLGRFEEARAALDDSIRISPVPQAFSNLGVAHYLLGRFPEATVSFQRAVDLAPKNYRWHVYLGDALSQIPNESARARAAYETALPLVTAELAVNPADAVSVVLLGRCLAMTGAPERAWSEIRRGVALAPEDSEVLETAAAAAMVLGKKAEALTWLQKAVAKGYGLVEIQHDPVFAPLRGEPAFQTLASLAPSPTAPSPSTGDKR
ncbi:MAG: protein kinase [Acidobacteria bacterium]|nr:protein kinase [Acidobacteriota bacterium]